MGIQTNHNIKVISKSKGKKDIVVKQDEKDVISSPRTWQVETLLQDKNTKFIDSNQILKWMTTHPGTSFSLRDNPPFKGKSRFDGLRKKIFKSTIDDDKLLMDSIDLFLTNYGKKVSKSAGSKTFEYYFDFKNQGSDLSVLVTKETVDDVHRKQKDVYSIFVTKGSVNNPKDRVLYILEDRSNGFIIEETMTVVGNSDGTESLPLLTGMIKRLIKYNNKAKNQIQ